MKLENIILQNGDIIVLANGAKYMKAENFFIDILTTQKYINVEHSENEIVKIERPVKYETIYEKKEILDDMEKEYLKNIIKPFRKRIISIVKLYNCNGNFIRINLRNMENDFLEKIDFPYFRKDTIYNGMKLREEYSLKELGL